MCMGDVARKQCTRGSLASFTASQAISRSLQYHGGQLTSVQAMHGIGTSMQPCASFKTLPVARAHLKDVRERPQITGT